MKSKSSGGQFKKSYQTNQSYSKSLNPIKPNRQKKKVGSTQNDFNNIFGFWHIASKISLWVCVEIFLAQREELDSNTCYYSTSSHIPSHTFKPPRSPLSSHLQCHKPTPLKSFTFSVFLCFFSVFPSLSYIKMEGLIPFVYKAIMQYKNGKQGPIGSWLCESPSYSYMKLPGDSGRFHTSASSLIGSDYGFSASSPSSMLATSSTQIIVSSSVQSPHRCVNSPRVPT